MKYVTLPPLPQLLAGAATLCLATITDAQRAPTADPAHFVATDLTGRDHDSRELRRGPLLVVLITSPDGEGHLRAWKREFDARFGGRLRRLSLVSVHVPFFVPHDYVRSRARSETERASWENTWLAMHGEFEDVFHVPADATPWAWVVGRDGSVRTMVHGTAAAAAEPVWRALEALAAPPPSTATAEVSP